MSQTVKIQFFPLIRQSALIQTGDPDHISNQTDQSLRFLIDASCKNLHILILHKSVLHDLSKSGNGSQRRFQFMGNIGGKFSSQLFPFYFSVTSTRRITAPSVLFSLVTGLAIT